MDQEAIISEEIDSAFNIIIRDNFALESEKELLQIIDKYINSSQSEYTLAYICNKLDMVTKFSNSYTGFYGRYASFIKILLKSNNVQVIRYLEKYSSRNIDPEYFIILVEETCNAHMPTDDVEKCFLSICDVNSVTLPVVSKILETLGKDYYYLGRALLQKEWYLSLNRIIGLMDEEDSEYYLSQIVAAIVTYHELDASALTNFMIAVCNVNPNYVDIFMSHNMLNINSIFNRMMSQINTSLVNANTVKCIFQYVAKHHSSLLSEYENVFISVAKGHVLVDYAAMVPTSNKRHVLNKLVLILGEDSSDKSLVKFIRYFPEYKPLLSLL